MLDVAAAVGESDGGTAWVVNLTNVCNWLVGVFPEKAQDEIFGANPDARVSGVLTPSATTTKVPGGFRVTGKWHYNSGGWHADWALVGLPVVNDAGEMVDQGVASGPDLRTRARRHMVRRGHEDRAGASA